MSSGFLAAAYVAASILFILSLGGLSHQEQARRGNIYGIVGMAIAIVATVSSDQVSNLGLVMVLMLIGASAGIFVALKVQMTEMPELVAILHSFVGLAAVLVGFANYVDPSVHFEGVEKTIHDVEIYLGMLIGAVTFTGSVIAFGKLQGIIMQQAPPPARAALHQPGGSALPASGSVPGFSTPDQSVRACSRSSSCRSSPSPSAYTWSWPSAAPTCRS